VKHFPRCDIRLVLLLGSGIDLPVFNPEEQLLVSVTTGNTGTQRFVVGESSVPAGQGWETGTQRLVLGSESSVPGGQTQSS